MNNINLSTLEQEIINSILNYKKIILDLANQDSILPNWHNLMQPLEDARFNLDQKVNIICHLTSTQDSPEVRAIYTNILPKLSDFNADFLQNHKLNQKVLQLKNSKVFAELNISQQTIIENLLLDFNLAGVNLPLEHQQKYKTITTQLCDLSDQFSKNILDATNAWFYYVDNKDLHKLAGLPEHILNSAQQAAISRKYSSGWVLTLDFPCVDAVLSYAVDRELRKTIYTANISKASDITKQFDNSLIMQSIVNLRLELAELLGFNNYSEYSLVHKMAKTTQEVLDFLDQLANLAVPIAKQEFLNLQNFATQQDPIDLLQPWDVNFYAEQHKKVLFNLSDEELRNYFPTQLVLAGIFKLANSLFGLTVEEILIFDKWAPEIKFYKILDQDLNLRGFFYTDLYVRENKKSGAWMAECVSRHKLKDEALQLPIAFLVTNFAQGPLLYHEELLTLLHEFGHVLHHVLTKVDYISASGCNAVSWDAVELPSQFMEKWGYNWQFLQDVSMHCKTKEKISKPIFDSLINMKNYNAGMFMVRQLEFAMFDFKLHMYKPALKLTNSAEIITNQDIQNILDQIRATISVIPIAEFNRFQHGFCHIFAGGYAAGYYSYNWAEVLASDAFVAFKDADRLVVGTKFLNNILEMGGSKNAMELYIAFRGKKPEIQALLEYKGLLPNK